MEFGSPRESTPPRARTRLAGRAAAIAAALDEKLKTVSLSAEARTRSKDICSSSPERVPSIGTVQSSTARVPEQTPQRSSYTPQSPCILPTQRPTSYASTPQRASSSQSKYPDHQQINGGQHVNDVIPADREAVADLRSAMLSLERRVEQRIDELEKQLASKVLPSNAVADQALIEQRLKELESRMLEERPLQTSNSEEKHSKLETAVADLSRAFGCLKDQFTNEFGSLRVDAERLKAQTAELDHALRNVKATFADEFATSDFDGMKARLTETNNTIQMLKVTIAQELATFASELEASKGQSSDVESSIHGVKASLSAKLEQSMQLFEERFEVKMKDFVAEAEKMLLDSASLSREQAEADSQAARVAVAELRSKLVSFEVGAPWEDALGKMRSLRVEVMEKLESQRRELKSFVEEETSEAQANLAALRKEAPAELRQILDEVSQRQAEAMNETMTEVRREVRATVKEQLASTTQQLISTSTSLEQVRREVAEVSETCSIRVDAVHAAMTTLRSLLLEDVREENKNLQSSTSSSLEQVRNEVADIADSFSTRVEALQSALTTMRAMIMKEFKEEAPWNSPLASLEKKLEASRTELFKGIVACEGRISGMRMAMHDKLQEMEERSASQSQVSPRTGDGCVTPAAASIASLNEDFNHLKEFAMEQTSKLHNIVENEISKLSRKVDDSLESVKDTRSEILEALQTCLVEVTSECTSARDFCKAQASQSVNQSKVQVTQIDVRLSDLVKRTLEKAQQSLDETQALQRKLFELDRQLMLKKATAGEATKSDLDAYAADFTREISRLVNEQTAEFRESLEYVQERNLASEVARLVSEQTINLQQQLGEIKAADILKRVPELVESVRSELRQRLAMLEAADQRSEFQELVSSQIKNLRARFDEFQETDMPHEVSRIVAEQTRDLRQRIAQLQVSTVVAQRRLSREMSGEESFTSPARSPSVNFVIPKDFSEQSTPVPSMTRDVPIPTPNRSPMVHFVIPKGLSEETTPVPSITREVPPEQRQEVAPPVSRQEPEANDVKNDPEVHDKPTVASEETSKEEDESSRRIQAALELAKAARSRRSQFNVAMAEAAAAVAAANVPVTQRLSLRSDQASSVFPGNVQLGDD